MWIVFCCHIFLGEKIVEEAGGAVTCMDGKKFCVFDRSVLVSNGALHGKVCNCYQSTIPTYNCSDRCTCEEVYNGILTVVYHSRFKKEK